MAIQPQPTEAFQEGGRLRILRGIFEDPRSILTAIGALVVKQSQRAFREQKMGKTAWKSRGETGMNPNWPAIIADFASGRASPPERRFQDSPVLMDTGMLKKSVTFRLAGRDVVEVGSNLPYAGVLHAGGESKTAALTKSVQDRIQDWMDRAVGRAKKARGRKWGVGTTPKQMARDSKAVQGGDRAQKLRWLLSPRLTGQQLTVRHPARPIVGVPENLAAEIEREVGVKVRAG